MLFYGYKLNYILGRVIDLKCAAGKLKIAIVGCGTGGLAAAAYLQRDGHRVSLYERFNEPKPIGAGLMLQPTGLACLADLRLDQQAMETSEKIYKLDGRARHGRTIFDLSCQQLGSHCFDLGTHRSVLIKARNLRRLRRSQRDGVSKGEHRDAPLWSPSARVSRAGEIQTGKQSRSLAAELLKLVLSWFDNETVQADTESRVDWKRIIPFLIMHLSCLCVTG